jgi:hypothetical protein
MVVTLLLGLYAILSGSAFVVSRVELRHAERLSAQDVNRVLNLAGAQVFSVQPEQLAAALTDAFPELQDFAIRVGFPARVVIEVAERQPVIAWQQSDITVWIDSAGVAFIPEGEVSALVQVRALEAPPALEGYGLDRHQLIRPELVELVLALDAYAPEGVELLYSASHGLGWVDPRGWEAYFGSEIASIDQRIAVYNAVLAELQSRGLMPTLISVAQLHAPYYRLDY